MTEKQSNLVSFWQWISKCYKNVTIITQLQLVLNWLWFSVWFPIIHAWHCHLLCAALTCSVWSVVSLLNSYFHLKKNRHIIHNKIINIRAFISHLSISYDKIFVLVSRYLSLWTWSSLELAIIIGSITFCEIFR